MVISSAKAFLLGMSLWLYGYFHSGIERNPDVNICPVIDGLKAFVDGYDYDGIWEE